MSDEISVRMIFRREEIYASIIDVRSSSFRLSVRGTLR